MKTYLAGVITGILVCLAFKYRATLIPWLKSEEERAAALLKKRAQPSSSNGAPPA